MKSEDASSNESGSNRIDSTVKKAVEIIMKIISVETNLELDIIREKNNLKISQSKAVFLRFGLEIKFLEYLKKERKRERSRKKTKTRNETRFCNEDGQITLF